MGSLPGGDVWRVHPLLGGVPEGRGGFIPSREGMAGAFVLSREGMAGAFVPSWEGCPQGGVGIPLVKRIPKSFAAVVYATEGTGDFHTCLLEDAPDCSQRIFQHIVIPDTHYL